jgi:hypothetical protein
MAQHSKFSASAASRWLACPGSMRMAEGLADNTSEAAARGTLGHALAEHCLLTHIDAWDVDSVEGKDVDEDLQGAVQVYLDLVRGRGGQVLPEVKVQYDDVLGVAADEGFGTSDSVILMPGNKIEVWDLKLGHRWVSAEDNPQLILYASGVVRTLESLGEEVDEVLIGICQPYLSETGSFQVMSREQLSQWEATFREGVAKVKEAEAHKLGPTSKKWRTIYLNPGEEQCKYCRANSSCQALADAVDHTVEAAKDEEFDVITAPALIDDSKLAEAYAKIAMLEVFIKAVESECSLRAHSGKPVAGTKLVFGREGNRKWGSEEEAKKSLTGVIDSETLYTTTLISPSQAEKVLKKNKTEFDLNSLVVRSPAKPTLVSTSDPRETFAPSGGVEDFN